MSCRKVFEKLMQDLWKKQLQPQSRDVGSQTVGTGYILFGTSTTHPSFSVHNQGAFKFIHPWPALPLLVAPFFQSGHHLHTLPNFISLLCWASH
uniref:Uncharacterized protein n=1 Tax=Physcomitrium patens TaxID=3218 RepID=A0A2K1KV00_PHYPA|nr:hypothetical protein PHYPA_004608 [Physcomitrium patens]